MKKLLLPLGLFVILISCSKEEEEDSINATTYYLSSQQEVNDFQPLTTVQIDTLKISGSDISNLTTLLSLSSLSTLIIDTNPKLIQLEGLQNLSKVNNLIIINNRSLGDFKAIKGVKLDKSPVGDKALLSSNSLKIQEETGTFIIRNNLYNPEAEDLENDYLLPENIHSGDVYIRSKTDLETFAQENYTAVEGFFQIQGVSEITGLLGLESLKRVTGNISLGYLNIENLEGLENIISAKALSVYRNPALKNLNGIENLLFVPGGFSVLENDILNNIDAASQIHSAIYFEISDNRNLEYFPDFPNLHEVGEDLPNFDVFTDRYRGGVTITNNKKLSSLEGLQNLQRSEGYIIVKNNPLLENLHGLDKLRGVRGTIDISNNESLLTLSGLETLEGSSTLNIHDNKMLQSLQGVESGSFGKLFITNNENLERLMVTNRDYMGTVEIKNNPLIEDLDGFQNINTIGLLIIENNASLKSLKGLENLVKLVNSFIIRSNPNLVDYCAMNSEFSIYNQFLSSYEVEDNAYNPNKEEMLSNDRCKL